MVLSLAVILGIIGIALIGIAGIGLVFDINIPVIVGDIFEIAIPFLQFSFNMTFFLFGSFWIVLALIEIVIMGFSMRENGFMEMLYTFISLNAKAIMFFYNALHKLFILAIASIRIVLPTK